MTQLLMSSQYAGTHPVPGAASFLKKVVRVRSKLLAEKKGNCSGSMIDTHKQIKKWIEFYNPTDAQCAKYCLRNRSMVAMIIPGPGSPIHESLTNQLDDICIQAK